MSTTYETHQVILIFGPERRAGRRRVRLSRKATTLQHGERRIWIDLKIDERLFYNGIKVGEVVVTNPIAPVEVTATGL
jgi:hypothetical protein